VTVTEIIEGTGKHKGRMGALMTPMGKVGTGFTDQERKEWWGRKALLGNHPTLAWLIEVECMQLTPDGKFRHPRFLRIRYDK
jgi:ATP-dependent DNA ligase